MGESKHTPGPWEIEDPYTKKEKEESSRSLFIRQVGEECALAAVWPDVFSRTLPLRANAHLIAAAPDLLEACEELMECDVDSYMTKILTRVIKKAKGER